MVLQMNNYRTYEELAKLGTFDERFRYLMLNSKVGFETFGENRRLNQEFYASDIWKEVRRFVIMRDYGCDLGVLGNDIQGAAYVHHMNPVTVDDVINRTDILLDPNYMITVSFATHNAIHYGDTSYILSKEPLIRIPGDTCPWR